ncbi:MAG: flagellar motor switch protein FliG, partial [bacterium]|nr:flagellar motor switch protein FliG [bacterium]MCP4726868.1 flagellar motor switch protein FliG [bacterium]
MEEEPLTIENLSGRQKCAILIIAIGTEAASQIFKHLKDKDVERLAIE